MSKTTTYLTSQSTIATPSSRSGFPASAFFEALEIQVCFPLNTAYNSEVLFIKAASTHTHPSGITYNEYSYHCTLDKSC